MLSCRIHYDCKSNSMRRHRDNPRRINVRKSLSIRIHMASTYTSDKETNDIKRVCSYLIATCGRHIDTLNFWLHTMMLLSSEI